MVLAAKESQNINQYAGFFNQAWRGHIAVIVVHGKRQNMLVVILIMWDQSTVEPSIFQPLNRQLGVLLLGQSEKQTADVFDMARDSFDERLASGVAAQEPGALFKSGDIDMNSKPESRLYFRSSFL